MPEYIFILGREPELSVAEIAAVASRLGVTVKWNKIAPRYTEVELSQSPSSWFEQLAGTVKLAEVVGRVPPVAESITALAQRTLESLGYSQWHFGFSWYGSRAPAWLREVGMTLKREAKALGRRARFVVSREPVLSSVVVAKNKLLPPQGCEFIVLPDGPEAVLARTLAVQQFEDWGERDFGRPQRDARVGLLPPKLARAMVNLSCTPLDQPILDPFCGSGTVLQEAAVLGYQQLWGFDADARGIERTQANLGWLRERYPELGFTAQVEAVPIEQLSRRLAGKNFPAIITEPYLGPPLRGNEPDGKLRQISSELTDLYHIILRVLVHVVAPGGRIVMVWPIIKAGNSELLLPLHGFLPKVGLKIVNTLPSEAPQEWHTPRETLRYERPDARVGREIIILQR